MNRPALQNQAHPAQVAQEFLTRADLKGGEVEAYAQTFNWLQAILKGELTVQPIADTITFQKRIDELEEQIKSLISEKEPVKKPKKPKLEPVE